MAPIRNAKGQKKKVNRTTILAQVSEIEGEPQFKDAWEMYNLGSLGCNLHGCPNPKASNCRQHPFCLSRMGLEKFEKLIKSCEVVQTKIKETMESRDKHNQPCGLVNSGNFCYVNSFLQIFFNDLDFRQIIYDWIPTAGWEPPQNSKMNVQAVMNALQRLFYMMYYTPFEDFETVEFTTALHLRDEQQDPSELSALFFQALDRNLPNHPNGKEIIERINRRFSGTMEQRMVCPCGRDDISSVNSEGTVTLSIESAKTLSEMFKMEFAPQQMTELRCGVCNQVGTTTKYYGFGKLPAVLRIMLNRYTYASGSPKKLKTPIQFPRELSGSTLKPGDSTASKIVYELVAVMVHQGEQTYCGHYYDLVKSPENGKWYEYNDENVKEIRAPGVDREKPNPPSKPTPEQKLCYGLIYRQRAEVTELRYPAKELTAKWEEEIQFKFNHQNESDMQAVELGLYEVKKRQNVVGEIMDALELKPTNENEYVSRPECVAFLPYQLMADVISREYERVERKKKIVEAKKIQSECDLKDSDNEFSPAKSDTEIIGSDSQILRTCEAEFIVEREKIGPLLDEYSIELCGHGNLQFEQVISGTVKAVSASAVDEFLERYGVHIINENGGPLTVVPRGDKVCLECIRQMQQEAVCVREMAEDEKLASLILREEKMRCSVKNRDVRPLGCMYISKKALKNYKSLANKEIDFQRSVKDKTTTVTLKVNSPIVINGNYRKRRASSSTNEGSPPNKMPKIETNEVVVGVNNISAFHNISISNTDDEDISSIITNIIMNVEVEINTIANQNGDVLDENESPAPSDPNSIRSLSSAESTSEIAEQMCCGIIFNIELRCKHGGVNLDEYRLSVSAAEWEMLSKHFTNKFSVRCDTVVCDSCKEDDKAKNEEEEEMWMKVRELNRKIGELIRTYEKRNPLKSSLGPNAEYTHAVCSNFLRNAASLVKSSKSRRGISTKFTVCQECVICEHDNPYLSRDFYVPSAVSDIFQQSCAYLVPITTSEWNDIVCIAGEGYVRPVKFSGDHDIIDKFCVECFERKTQELELLRCVYKDKLVFLRLAADDAVSNNGAEPESIYRDVKAPIATTRRTATKNLLRVRIGSNATVRDLKVKLYSLTKQSPSDQLIYKEIGADALEDDMTLENARVFPDNEDFPLVLVVQTTTDIAINVDENNQRELERGFMDTALFH